MPKTDFTQLPCQIEGCENNRPKSGTRVCYMHRSRLRKGLPLSAPRMIGKKGTGYKTKKGYIRMYLPSHPNATTNGYVMQHVVVMSETLGRPLKSFENVHHINGNKSDNRPENLELWASKQPKGQRVEDLLAWARELLKEYGEI